MMLFSPHNRSVSNIPVLARENPLEAVTVECTYSPAIISLPNDKIFDWSKLKAVADNKINSNKKSELVLGRVEPMVGKGEDAGYQHFLLFQQ